MKQLRSIAIVGLGLIGGSIAKAVHACDGAECIYGFDADNDTLQEALREGVIHRVCDIENLCHIKELDVIVLAVHPQALNNILPSMQSLVDTSVAITDCCSVKSRLCQAVEQHWHKVPNNLVFSHPMAGSEKSGFSSASEELFRGKSVLISPIAGSDIQAKIEMLWQSIGMKIEYIDIEEHDKVLSATSHMPHLVAYALASLVCTQTSKIDIENAIGSGLKDTTRLAASSPSLWVDILSANADNIVQDIDQLKIILDQYRAALEDSNQEQLSSLIEQAAQWRHSLDLVKNESKCR